ncbi:MAG: hypothetical protein NZ570_05305 [Candidatus Caldarchaeum sp.]|nr:hypothetical protein [Candidatus Caldarchaeum sp.]MDW7978099.1 hypothetical protein [Candidatus Caldarchaeum sp.]MDW8360195.1 hypothetical protein [Candidatus Caldarchaeum sp.]
MKKTSLLLIALACLSAVAPAESQEIQTRHIHVADGGLLFITDTIPVASASEVVRIGFPSETVKNLVGFYLLDDRGSITPGQQLEGVYWLEVRPENRWDGASIAVVTVWTDMLVELPGDRYQIVLPSNPLMERRIDRSSLRFTLDGTPSISSVSGAEVKVSEDKRFAEGEVSGIEPKQFKTITAIFENFDLLRYSVDSAELKLDMATNTATVKITVRNTGSSQLSSIITYLGRESEVLSVSRGLAKLSHSWDSAKGLLKIEFDPLKENERIILEVVYKGKGYVEQVGGRDLVKVPRLLNATFKEYFLTVETPPAEQVSFSDQPWTLRLLENNRRSASFRYENLFIVDRLELAVSIVPTNPVPLPAILIVAIAVAAGFQIVSLRRKPRPPTPGADLSSFILEMNKHVEAVIEKLNGLKVPEEAVKTLKLIEDNLREAKEKISTARKGIKGGETLAALNNMEKMFSEANSILQAVGKTLDDYNANRIPRKVYTRVANEYVKECRKTVGEALNILEMLSRLK